MANEDPPIYRGYFDPNLLLDASGPVRLRVRAKAEPPASVTLEVLEKAKYKGASGQQVDEGNGDRVLGSFDGAFVKEQGKKYWYFKNVTSKTIAHTGADVPKLTVELDGTEYTLGVPGTEATEGTFWELSYRLKDGDQVLFSSPTIASIRRPIARFMAVDGTQSPDADAFCAHMNGLPGAVNLGTRIKTSTPEYPLKDYLRLENDVPLAFNFQKHADNQQVPDVTRAGRDAIVAMVRRGRVEVADAHVEDEKGGWSRADFLYLASHGYLDGNVKFLADPDDPKKVVEVLAPNLDTRKELSWKGMGWLIVAACGSLSPHYRWFGIPGHDGHDDAWDYTEDGQKYALTTRSHLLNWYYLLKHELPDESTRLHGVLGYWMKAPGGDTGGKTEDSLIAEYFCAELRRGTPVVKAWKVANQRVQNRRPTREEIGWAAIVNERFAEETWDDLRFARITDDTNADYLYTDSKWSSSSAVKLVPVKQAFVEANKAANFKDQFVSIQGKSIKLRCHPYYDYRLNPKARRGALYYPPDLTPDNWAERLYVRQEIVTLPSGKKGPDPKVKERVTVGEGESARRAMGYKLESWLKKPIAEQVFEILPDLTQEELESLHPQPGGVTPSADWKAVIVSHEASDEAHKVYVNEPEPGLAESVRAFEVEGPDGEQVFVQVTFGKRLRTDPPPSVSKDAGFSAQGRLEPEADGDTFRVKLTIGAGKAKFWVRFGHEGGVEVEVKVGATQDVADDARTFVTWRKLYYELMVPQLLTSDLQDLGGGKYDLPAGVKSKVTERLGAVFIEYELADTVVVPTGSLLRGNVFDDDWFAGLPLENRGRKVYVISKSTAQPSGATFAQKNGKRSIKVRLCDALYADDTNPDSLRRESVLLTLTSREQSMKLHPTRHVFPRVLTTGERSATYPLDIRNCKWSFEALGDHPCADLSGDLPKAWLKLSDGQTLRVQIPEDWEHAGKIGPAGPERSPLTIQFRWSTPYAINGSKFPNGLNILKLNIDFPTAFATTVCHELGHSMGMTILAGRSKPPPGLENPLHVDAGGTYYRDGKPVGKKGIRSGHKGGHCAAGIAVAALTRRSLSGAGGTCTMFGEGGSEKDRRGGYCDECVRFIRARRLSDLHSSWRKRDAAQS